MAESKFAKLDYRAYNKGHMVNWQERDTRLNQEKTQRENNRISFRQSAINSILEGFSVRSILEEIRTDVWREGEIREVTKKDRDGFSYREGLELVTKVPTILVFKDAEFGEVYRPPYSSDGVSSGKYTTHGVTGYGYQVAIGDIEVSLRITVGKRTDWAYDHSEGFISVFEPKTARAVLIEDAPFLKDDKLVDFKGKYWDGRDEVWFPLLEEEHDRYKHYIEGRKSTIEVSYNPILDKVFQTRAFEEGIVSHVKNRRNTKNLPFQMKERSHRFIAEVPYKKADRIIDVMEYFRRSIESRRLGTNSYNEYEFPPRVS